MHISFIQVAKALGNLKFPYVYPDPESRQLRAALAEDSGLESEYILVGCGADELIDLIMRLACSLFYTCFLHEIFVSELSNSLVFFLIKK